MGLHNRLFHQAISLFSLLLFVFVCQWGFVEQASAQKADDKKSPSDRVIRAIENMAIAGLPNEIMRPDGTIFKLDKSDPKKFRIPIDDKRRIIRIANRTAWAKICELPKLDVLNFETMFQAEIKKKKWTNEQLAVIHALHLQTVAWMASEQSQIVEGATEKDKGKVVKTFKKLTCSKQRKDQTRKAILEYVKQAKKS